MDKLFLFCSWKQIIYILILNEDRKYFPLVSGVTFESPLRERKIFIAVPSVKLRARAVKDPAAGITSPPVVMPGSSWMLEVSQETGQRLILCQ